MLYIQQPLFCWRIWTLPQLSVPQVQTSSHRRRRKPLPKRLLPLPVSSNDILALVQREVKDLEWKSVPPLPLCVFAGVESSVPENADELSARTTLIICPLSVLSNWLVGAVSDVDHVVRLSFWIHHHMFVLSVLMCSRRTNSSSMCVPM